MMQRDGNAHKSKKDELTESTEAILNKLPDLRSPHDHLILAKFIHKSAFFSTLAELFSLDFAKSLLRHAHIHEIPKGRLLCSKDAPLSRIVLFLTGKLAIIDQQPSESQNQQQSLSFYLQQMLSKATSIIKDIRRKTKQGREDPNELSQFKTSKASLFEMTVLQTLQEEEQLFNVKSLMAGIKYTETLVSLLPSVVLSISAKAFYQVLAAYLKKTKSEKISAFRKFEYFNQIESERLIHIVDEMPLVTMKKGEFLYREGEVLQNVYLLISGGIKVIKNVDMFRENPNFFYLDRCTLQSPTLPYADFSQVYNYKPKKKLLELGIVSEMGIFGEEELFTDGSIRETSAQVCTQTSTFYAINLSKLEAALHDKKNFIIEFKQGLFNNQTRNKIIYRQQKLSDLLMCENKNNMDYFYFEEGAKLDPDRKFKISKVNNLISPAKSLHKKKATSVSAAFYNTFNFTKLPRSARATLHTSQVEVSKESRILELVHTVDASKPKTAGSSTHRNSKLSKKYSIDIKNPLFELAYFQKKRKEELRIEKESRMKPVGGQSTIRTAKSGSSSRRFRNATSRQMFLDS